MLERARESTYDHDRSMVLRRAIDEMIIASRRYGSAFKRTVEAFLQKGWRADVYYLESKIEPLLTHNLKILQDIEFELVNRMGKRVQESLETSSVVSGYVWWFLTIVYFMLILAYLAFEKTIRQPLVLVARALHAQGKGEEYDLPSAQHSVTESELLIEAFRNMKEQVDSRQMRLESILSNAADGIVIIDRNGLIETLLALRD